MKLSMKGFQIPLLSTVALPFPIPISLIVLLLILNMLWEKCFGWVFSNKTRILSVCNFNFVVFSVHLILYTVHITLL